MPYGSYRLKRVYYSAFSPIPDAPSALPSAAPPLVREHRLYQADWLMRYYGFAHDEIVGAPDGMLALDIDPKLSWALAHRDRFPVDLNRAPKEMLLRVPAWAMLNKSSRVWAPWFGMGCKAQTTALCSLVRDGSRYDPLARQTWLSGPVLRACGACDGCDRTEAMAGVGGAADAAICSRR